VERESQKSILNGIRETCQKVGNRVKAGAEAFLGKMFTWSIFVKVNDNWRNDPSKLKRFGYPL
jgi:GTPase Era involved in 16S rRNA processing